MVDQLVMLGLLQETAVESGVPWAAVWSALSAIAAIAAIAAAVAANRRADRAIEKADTANALAAHGNTLAGEANRHSEQAKEAALDANAISAAANAIAEKALRLQEEDGRLRLSAELLLGDISLSSSPLPLPVVRVVNLSAFAVTISDVRWALKDRAHADVCWEEERLVGASGSLPRRVRPRSAIGIAAVRNSFNSIEALEQVRTCVVTTECGAEVEATVENWDEQLIEWKRRPSAHSNSTARTRKDRPAGDQPA